MKKILSILVVLVCFAGTAFSQTVGGRNFGIDGFAAYEGVSGTNWYHAGGTTGGQGGKVVYANNFAELQAYLQSSKPYIILVDHDITTGIKCYIDASSTGHLCDAQDGSEGVESTYGERIMIASNKTLIGIADAQGNAPLFSHITFVMQCATNVIIRNCRFTMVGSPILKNGENKIVAWRDGAQVETGDPDCIGIQADATSAKTDYSSHIWIDHCEFFNGDAANKDRYDGLLDCKNNVQWLTFSYNYFHNHDKSCLWGKGNSDIYEGCRTISAHHNKFINIDGSRLPLQRGGHLHYMNNYQEGCSDGWDLRAQAVSYADACYFKDSKAPILPDGGEGALLTVNKDEGYGVIYDNCQRVIKSPSDGFVYVNEPAKGYDAEFNLADYSAIGTWVPTDTWSGYYVNCHDKAADVPTVVANYSGAGKIEIWKSYADAVPAESASDYEEATKSQQTAACYDAQGNKVAGVAEGGSEQGEGQDGTLLFSMAISSSASDLTLTTTETQNISSYCSTLTGGTAVIGLRAASSQKVVGSDSSQRHIRTPKNDVYVKLTLDEALQTGDVISFTGNASSSYEICFMADATYSTAEATSSHSYIIPSTSVLVGKTEVWISRAQPNNTYIQSLKIVRPENTTAINEVTSAKVNNAVKTAKYIKNGQFVVIRDGKTYNAVGAKMK